MELNPLHRIPRNLDLSPAVGHFTTEVRVGQFDLQFTFGPVHFAVQSPINLFRDGQVVAHWEEGRWPDPGFLEILNVAVTRCEVVSDRRILFEFENGIAMHLEDSSDSYECMQISFEGDSSQWIL
jgi:hypothetical protein